MRAESTAGPTARNRVEIQAARIARAGGRVLVAALMLASASGAAATPPATQQDADEIAQGREADRQIEAEFGFYPDERLRAYIDRIGQKVAAVSERPTLPWTFRVLDTPVLNAFALPGGFVYVTRGMLAHLNSESELAGVLGHEVGHVAGRHGDKRQTQSTLANLALVLGSATSRTFNNYFLRTGLAQATTGLLLTKYSRGQEIDSDERAARYSLAAGYDPRGIGTSLETLQAQEHNSDRDRLPGWLSTHPQAADRVERSAEWTTKQLRQSGAISEDLVHRRAALLFAIDGLLVGDNPREGYIDGDDFVHPQLGFAVTFPHGWELRNGRQAVLSVAPGERAFVQMTLAPVSAATAPQAYVKKHLEEMGARVDKSRRVDIGGLDGLEATFQVRGQGRTYGGIGLWVSSGNRLYELLAMTSPGDLSSYQVRFRNSLRSFREITDAKILATTASRIEVVRILSPITLAGVLESHPENNAPDVTIELLNHMRLADVVAAGDLVKLVTGGRPQES